jgi:hypothetical protein
LLNVLLQIANKLGLHGGGGGTNKKTLFNKPPGELHSHAIVRGPLPSNCRGRHLATGQYATTFIEIKTGDISICVELCNCREYHNL